MRFGVSKEKQDALKAKMTSLGIGEQDIEEKFIRAAKPGGQKVNKTSCCVYLKHKPTGIEVKCQKERCQSLNRFLARRILSDKVEALVRGRESQIEKERQKIRRQKRRRSRRAKEKMLRDKKLRSQIKDLRKPLFFDDGFGGA